MNKILVTILLSNYIFADPVNEASNLVLLAVTKSIGQTIYQQCILKPPATPDQIATCTDLYVKKYLPNEVLLTLPNVIKPALELSPYVNSSYDICRNETGHIIFSENIPGMPYCTVKANGF